MFEITAGPEGELPDQRLDLAFEGDASGGFEEVAVGDEDPTVVAGDGWGDGHSYDTAGQAAGDGSDAVEPTTPPVPGTLHLYTDEGTRVRSYDLETGKVVADSAEPTADPDNGPTPLTGAAGRLVDTALAGGDIDAVIDELGLTHGQARQIVHSAALGGDAWGRDAEESARSGWDRPGADPADARAHIVKMATGLAAWYGAEGTPAHAAADDPAEAEPPAAEHLPMP